MARNEHDGRSLEERLASLDAMSGDTGAQSAEGEQSAQQENAPPDEDAGRPEAESAAQPEPESEQSDPNANPWLAAPPSFQQAPETGYPPQTFGPPQPPPYEGGPTPQPFDGGMLPPPYAAGGYDPSQAPQQPPHQPQLSPYDANGNTAPPLDRLPPYPADQNALGQQYQPIDPATGQPFPQDTDASGRPYVPIDPNTGQPLQPDAGAQPFPQDPNAAAAQYPPVDPATGQPYPQDPGAGGGQFQAVDPATGQPYPQYQPVDPSTGQPYGQDPNAAGAQYAPVDPNTGQPYGQDPNAGGGQYAPVDPNTGQPYMQDPGAGGGQFQAVDPATGQPYAQDPIAAGAQYAPVDPNTGQPYAQGPAGAQYPTIDPGTGQPQPRYGYPGGPPQDQQGYPQALNQMMQPAPGYPAAHPQQPQQPQEPQNADSLSSENLLGERRIAPSSGWRRAVYKATAGGIHPGESQTDLRRKDLIARARTVVAGGHHRVAVMSLKGGVGKTTTTTGLGSMLGSFRGDRVIAVDANPDRGTLSDKVRLETAATVRDLLNNRDQIHRYADVRAFTSQNEARLEILASDRDPAVSEAFSAEDYAAVAVVLEQYYSVCITDCGTGLLHSAMAGVLSLADQLVLVSSPSVDGARSASATLDWLEAHDHSHLVRNGVVVLSMVRNRTRSQVDLDKLQAHFESRCRAVVRIPYDDHLEEGAEVELEQLAPATREAYLTLAAVVGDGFAYQRPTES
ncbi:AAA family ATPase [Spirillospora sp. NPDC048824]|uniref:MinD/ParA family ATP-binding protein n=1 Tax=Spirillospora sp. NPDC048824 TaxID=3364526 RepID=UPI00371385B4